jgi:riboflavin transporter FmnP
MSALAAILMLFDFPISFMFPSFLQFDFSELPALITSFSLGPVYGVIVEAIKVLVNLAINGTQTGFVGEAANFIVGGTFVFSAGLIYKLKQSRGGAVLSMAAATLAMSLVAALANYYVLIPLYSKIIVPLDAIISMSAKIVPFVKDLLGVVCFAIIPFNLFKGIIISAITFFLYKQISPVLKKQ